MPWSASAPTVTLTSDADVAAEADGLVVPGRRCVRRLHGRAATRSADLRSSDVGWPAGGPYSASVSGMQVLFDEGVEHGVRTEGFGEWPGVVEQLEAPILPHMGWNTVSVPAGSRLFAGLEGERFYFVHSYAARAWTLPSDGGLTPATVTWSEHGGDRFVAAVENGALSATQFHPEKSGDAGAALLGRLGQRTSSDGEPGTPAVTGVRPLDAPRRAPAGGRTGSAGQRRATAPRRRSPGDVARARLAAPFVATYRLVRPIGQAFWHRGKAGRVVLGGLVAFVVATWWYTGSWGMAIVALRLRRPHRSGAAPDLREQPLASLDMTLELLPAVDVADGQAVQLVQGVAGTEKRFGDPVKAALAWQDAGAEWVHLVDLDAAFGRGSNRELLAEIVGRLDVNVEMSGGIRDDASLASRDGHRLPSRQHRDGRPGAPRVVRPGDRDVRRPGRHRARRTRHHPRRPRLDPGRRRPLGGPRAPRPRRLRAVRRHRRRQGRHAQGPQPRPAARRLRHARTSRSWRPAGSRPSTTSEPSPQLTGEGVEGAIIGTALYVGAFTLQEALEAVRR